jgi:hypothetical protein
VERDREHLEIHSMHEREEEDKEGEFQGRGIEEKKDYTDRELDRDLVLDLEQEMDLGQEMGEASMRRSNDRSLLFREEENKIESFIDAASITGRSIYHSPARLLSSLIEDVAPLEPWHSPPLRERGKETRSVTVTPIRMTPTRSIDAYSSPDLHSQNYYGQQRHRIEDNIESQNLETEGQRQGSSRAPPPGGNRYEEDNGATSTPLGQEESWSLGVP